MDHEQLGHVPREHIYGLQWSCINGYSIVRSIAIALHIVRTCVPNLRIVAAVACACSQRYKYSYGALIYTAVSIKSQLKTAVVLMHMANPS